MYRVKTMQAYTALLKLKNQRKALRKHLTLVKTHGYGAEVTPEAAAEDLKNLGAMLEALNDEITKAEEELKRLTQDDDKNEGVF